MIYSILISIVLTTAVVLGIVEYMQRLRRVQIKQKLMEVGKKQTRTKGERDEAMAQFKSVYDAYVSKYGDPAERVSKGKPDTDV